MHTFLRLSEQKKGGQSEYIPIHTFLRLPEQKKEGELFQTVHMVQETLFYLKE
jgi:hypothetical protein